VSLTVLSVAYPFAPVSRDPVGGSEQVLGQLDRALVAAGHRSIVIAPEGSSVAGELLPTPPIPDTIEEFHREPAHAAVRQRIAGALARANVDLVHLHGLDFHAYLPPPGPPVLVTLHLPLDWYPPEALRPARARTWLHPVSAAQARTAPGGAVLGAPIENGVPIPQRLARKRGFALCIGRVCPEKGVDDALKAARAAGMPLRVAGTVFPYREHRAYFRDCVQPLLDRGSRWIGPVAGPAKQRLLAQARCVVVPSKARETSSLVAMEAMAAGTPVVAYRSGALPDIVVHGRTGFLVDVGDVAGLAAAMRDADGLDPGECRREAVRRFSADRMIRAYLDRYAALAAPAPAPA
jgi:glycosyltransferase involved in cell wall biosynthesis